MVPGSGTLRKGVGHIALHRLRGSGNLPGSCTGRPGKPCHRFYENPELAVGSVLRGVHLSTGVLEEVVGPEPSSIIGPGDLLYSRDTVLGGHRDAWWIGDSGRPYLPIQPNIHSRGIVHQSQWLGDPFFMLISKEEGSTLEPWPQPSITRPKVRMDVPWPRATS